eukprot:scaffold63366_cov17-Tisochrysis_lutea.AAC.3
MLSTALTRCCFLQQIGKHKLGCSNSVFQHGKHVILVREPARVLLSWAKGSQPTQQVSCDDDGGGGGGVCVCCEGGGGRRKRRRRHGWLCSVLTILLLGVQRMVVLTLEPSARYGAGAKLHIFPAYEGVGLSEHEELGYTALLEIVSELRSHGCVMVICKFSSKKRTATARVCLFQFSFAPSCGLAAPKAAN